MSGKAIQQQDKYVLRLPDGMRDQIKADALANDRSMNAEIIARLSGAQPNLRDQFAMAALTGLIAAMAHPDCGGSHNHYPRDTADDAYRLSDAMLKAREATDA